MTREEAIKQLKGDITESCATFSNQWEKDEEAISMAISALSDYDKMQEISLDLAFENDELSVQKAVEKLKENYIWIPEGMTNGEVMELKLEERMKNK
jgi:hypothetical protein